KDPKPPAPEAVKTISSKYGTGFSFTATAPEKPVPLPVIEINQDSVAGNRRIVSLKIVPGRDVNRLEVFTNDTPILMASVNGIALSSYYLEHRRGDRLLTHYISDNDPTEFLLHFPADKPLQLTLYEASNDLLNNPLFSVPERPADLLPMPFVLNDAVLLIKTIRFD
ncbi:MAG: peptidase M28, partial [Robiginitalea sp.]